MKSIPKKTDSIKEPIVLSISSGGDNRFYIERWSNSKLPHGMSFELACVEAAAQGASALAELFGRDECHRADAQDNQEVKYEPLHHGLLWGLRHALNVLMFDIRVGLEKVRMKSGGAP